MSISKILLGAIMMVGSVAAIVYSTDPAAVIPNLWAAFKTVVIGVLPAVIFVIGLFIVWLELDEMKIEKELKAEKSK